MNERAFIDLFGVPGGMSLGFSFAGMRPAGTLDIFESGIRTYRKNFPGVPEECIVQADASKNGMVERFQKNTSLRPGDVDVIIGGPPCQGFSTVGRVKIASLVKNGQRNGRSMNPRFIDDKRNHLYKSFVKFVKLYQPSAIVMENVRGMVSYRNGAVIRQIKEDFRLAGYANVEYMVLNAADFGVPQSRRRIFFMATRKKIVLTWPEKTHHPVDGQDRGSLAPGSRSHVTVGEAIGDLPYLPIPEKRSKQTDAVMRYWHEPQCEYQDWARGGLGTVHNNITRWHRQKDIEIFGHMGQGSRWKDLSDGDRKRIGYSNDSFDDKWKRLSSDRPSWTITSHLSKDGYMYIHPTQDRTISVREAARLQSFPDKFVFDGSRGAQFRQIGNAVPPLLAMNIAAHLKKILEASEK